LSAQHKGHKNDVDDDQTYDNVRVGRYIAQRLGALFGNRFRAASAIRRALGSAAINEVSLSIAVGSGNCASVAASN
jgi:hypothetical protein